MPLGWDVCKKSTTSVLRSKLGVNRVDYNSSFNVWYLVKPIWKSRVICTLHFVTNLVVTH